VVPVNDADSLAESLSLRYGVRCWLFG
jgi:hypothetical protein